jgi:hypothetical protein
MGISIEMSASKTLGETKKSLEAEIFPKGFKAASML